MKRRYDLYLYALLLLGLVCAVYNFYFAWIADQPVVDQRTPQEKLPVAAKYAEDKELLEKVLLDPHAAFEEEQKASPMSAPVPEQIAVAPVQPPVSEPTTTLVVMDAPRPLTPQQERLFRNTMEHFHYLSRPELVDPDAPQNRATEKQLLELARRRHATASPND